MKIINQCSRKIHSHLDKTTKKLLKVVPNEHFLGLESIILRDEFPYKNHKESRGLYWSKNGLERARIEISVSNIFLDKPHYCLIPFLGKHMLAEVLFHEIGHHFESINRGIKKNKKESLADKYAERCLILTFRRWYFFLKPFSPLLNFIADKILSSDKKDNEKNSE